MPDLKNALLLLKDGIGAKIGDLFIGKENDSFYVTAVSRHYIVNKPLALAELEEVKKIFTEGLTSSVELQEIIGGSKIDFHLATYEGNGVGICSEVNGIIKWSSWVKD